MIQLAIVNNTAAMSKVAVLSIAKSSMSLFVNHRITALTTKKIIPSVRMTKGIVRIQKTWNRMKCSTTYKTLYTAATTRAVL